jgi:hypothetical protein
LIRSSMPGSPEQRLEHLKARAEECYARMYECAPYELKDLKDDACSLLHQAMQTAEELGHLAEKQALEKRVEHIRAVFEQLRVDGGGRLPAAAPHRPPLLLLLTLYQWAYVLALLVGLVLALRYMLFAR